MTLKEKFQNIHSDYLPLSNNQKNECVLIADEFAIGFADWKDDNFLMYGNKTYYAKTSSQYFDVTKYTGKEKPTKYYTTKELLELYKKEHESNISR